MFFYLAMLYQALKVILLKPFREKRSPYVERIRTIHVPPNPMAPLPELSADIPDTTHPLEPEPTRPIDCQESSPCCEVHPTRQVDDFSNLARWQGSDVLAQWNRSDWGAPGFTAQHHTGFLTHLVELAEDVPALSLKVEQYAGPPKLGGVRSVGAEIKSKDLFHYGTYEFIVQMGNKDGKAVSGSVSAIQILTRKPPIFTDTHATDIRVEFLGDSPEWLYLSNSATTVEAVEAESSTVPFGELADEFHKIQIVWERTKVTYWVDDVPIAVHTKNVPFTPGKVCFSHYGSDGEWGGAATIGVERRMLVKRFSYIPA